MQIGSSWTCIIHHRVDKSGGGGRKQTEGWVREWREGGGVAREEKEENEQCVSGSVSVYSEEVIRELSLVPVRQHSR